MTQANVLIRKRGGRFRKVWFTPICFATAHGGKFHQEGWHGMKSTLNVAFPQLSSDIEYLFWWTCGMNHNSCPYLYPCHATKKDHNEGKENKIGNCEVLIRMLGTAGAWHDWLLRTLRYSVLRILLKGGRNVQKSICILKMLYKVSMTLHYRWLKCKKKLNAHCRSVFFHSS